MNKQTKILIVEDEILIANYINNILQDDGFLNIKEAYNQLDAQEAMHSFEPDIILMDINLNGLQTGLELSKQKNKEASIIYLTGQLDKATVQKALLTNPESYLTKPIKKEDLLAAIHLSILKNESNKFQFKDGYDIVYLDYDDILYIMADGNYIHIFSVEKKYTIRQTLAEVLSNLPENIFKQSHRSYIVNTTKVTRKSNGKLFLNDIELPLSRKHDKVFKITD